MKRTLITAIIFIAAAGLVLANGRPESGIRTPPWVESHPGFAEEQEEITVTGKLILNENEWSRLLADGKEYLLMYPYGIELDIDVVSGEEITVKGFSRDFETENGIVYAHLMVNRAIIQDKEYILAGPGIHYNSGSRGPHMLGGDINDHPHMPYRGPRR
jgi:hypothetical protein